MLYKIIIQKTTTYYIVSGRKQLAF